ncbi:MAG TPA: MFS transporter [Roseiflexaceae bacterium]|nr:MFS transporter [Roseiflexaceae bacterium]
MQQELTAAERRRGLIVMLADTFLMWSGFFMVIPLISVHYVDGLGWQAAAIGMVLAIRQVLQQGLSLFGGALADRLGTRGLICIGMAIRTLSFVAMAFADTLPLLWLAAILAALGGAFFESPSSAAVAALTQQADRSRYFAILGVVRGLGLSIGPLAGALLLRVDFSWVAMAAACCFCIAVVITVIFMPDVQVASERRGFTDGIGMALRDRRFMALTLLLMGYWFMWVQLTLALPLEATAVSGTTDAVSWIYVLNSVMSIVLQYPLIRLSERFLRPLPLLALGVALMAAGLGLISLAALSANIGMLLGCVAVFSLGALLATPSQQTVAAELANPAALGSYFGVNALALALGGGIGNYVGGLLYGLGKQLAMPALPWLVFGCVGLSSAIGLALLNRRLRSAQAAPGRPTVAE